MISKRALALLAVYAISVKLAPILTGTKDNIITKTHTRVGNLICSLALKKLIKRGLKNGSLMEIDGRYYEVVPEIRQ